jgi:uncharacterized protein
MNGIIGRQSEIKQMLAIKNSSKAAFVAMYGRRRVGKTFLIRQVFENDIVFQLSGLANAKLDWQLNNFENVMTRQNPEYQKLAKGFTWFDAFEEIIKFATASSKEKKVIFLDELPWLDTPNSGFMVALEHFWNSWASARKDIILIVCGSAASWMIKKLLNHKGGLHNRVTKRIKLEPFSLYETDLFLKMKGGAYEQYQVAQIYMALGGIPFYLEMIDTSKSAAQNINRLFFEPEGELKTEFNMLYQSLFKKAQDHIAIIKALAQKSKGLQREELIKNAQLNNGGGTTAILKELEECGFIRIYNAFEKKQRNQLYQLVDFYSLFYLKFVQNTSSMDETIWLSGIDNAEIRAWTAYAFEMLCLHHIQEVKHSLGISGINTATAAWQSTEAKQKAQIDLLIDRRDMVINICDMKFSINQFTITKKYAEEIRNKIARFKEHSKTRKSLFFTMITTFGVARNEYSGTFVQNELVLADLFKDVR